MEKNKNTPSALFLHQDQQHRSIVCLITPTVFSDSDEYVQFLLQKEKINFCVAASNLPNPPSSRVDAIDYILKARGVLGFEFQTAYLSLTYLDRFLSQRALQCDKAWAMQLLSVGCVSLAAKMQESESWGLSAFQVGEFRFDGKAIQRMELLILYTLEWKMDSITPFSYLPYFISVIFADSPPCTTLERIQELVMDSVKVVGLMDHYPSAIALAAVFMSLDQRLTRNTIELKINDIPCSGFLDLDDICNCYFIMQQSEKDSSKITELLSPMVSFKDSPGASSISGKRKTLAFGVTDDQNEGFLDKRHRESDT